MCVCKNLNVKLKCIKKTSLWLTVYGPHKYTHKTPKKVKKGQKQDFRKPSINIRK